MSRITSVLSRMVSSNSMSCTITATAYITYIYVLKSDSGKAITTCYGSIWIWKVHLKQHQHFTMTHHETRKKLQLPSLLLLRWHTYVTRLSQWVVYFTCPDIEHQIEVTSFLYLILKVTKGTLLLHLILTQQTRPYVDLHHSNLSTVSSYPGSFKPTSSSNVPLYIFIGKSYSIYNKFGQ